MKKCWIDIDKVTVFINALSVVSLVIFAVSLCFFGNDETVLSILRWGSFAIFSVGCVLVMWAHIKGNRNGDVKDCWRADVNMEDIGLRLVCLGGVMILVLCVVFKLL